jgi:plastocyanin
MREIRVLLGTLAVCAGLFALYGCGGGGGPDLSTLTVVVKSDRGVEKDVKVTLTPGRHERQTNQHGIAFFPDLREGSYTITASKTISGKQMRAVLTVDLGAGQARTVEMELKEPGALIITVHRSGLAEPGATVTLSPTGDTAVTGGAGRVRFEELAPGSYAATATKTIGGEEYTGSSSEIAVVSNEVVEVVIDISTQVSSGTIRVTILGPGGDPEPGVEVTLTPGDLTQVTNANGIAEFAGLAVGHYSIRATKTIDKIYYVATSSDVYLAGAVLVPVNLTLQPFSGAIHVTVTGAIGQGTAGPVEDATVTLQPIDREGTTDANGEVDFAGVAPGFYDVYAQKEDGGTLYAGAQSDVEVVDAVVQVEITLEEAGHALDVTVTRGGQPAEGVALTLNPGGLQGTTGATGTYRFNNLDPDTYDLTADYTIDTHEYQAEETGIVIGGAPGQTSVDLVLEAVAPTTYEVAMTADGFDPSKVELYVGDTVRWIPPSNEAHSTTSTDAEPGENATPNGLWDSGYITFPDTFEYTFNEIGTFLYFDRAAKTHRGSVVVR